MNWSCADSKLVRSGFFSQDQRNMVVNTSADRKKENCPPKNLPRFPPFIFQCTLQVEIYLWVAVVLPLQHKWASVHGWSEGHLGHSDNHHQDFSHNFHRSGLLKLSDRSLQKRKKNHVKITTQAPKYNVLY